MKTIIIKEHKHGSAEIISNIPDTVPAVEVVERWGRASIHNHETGRITRPGQHRRTQ
jgi:hypothetical protein